VPDDVPTPEPDPGAPRIGVDEWVASHEERREGQTGLLGQARERVERIPRPALFAAFGVAAAMVPLFTDNDYVIRVGFDTLLYMMLALGLNIAVGYAGLLDLGYVAFYGFGAYLYAMLASDKFGQHWPTAAIFPVVVIGTMILGLIVALPSRRLVGDYLAIVTLFFGQLFVTVTNNGNRISILGFTGGYDVTGGPNGIADIDPWHMFGHALQSVTSYFYVALGVFLVMLMAVYLLNESRTGRAWRSLREDSLAAEMMGMPVNRLKLVAFALGAGVAGLTGTLFASLNTAVFASDFDVPLLITVYAMLILGGAGSLGGVILGALVVNVSLEALRTPNHATWIVTVLVAATLVAKLRPWRWLAAVVVGTIAFGFAVHAILAAVWPSAVEGEGYVGGRIGEALSHWVPLPSNPRVAGNWGFVALIALVLVMTTVRPVVRNLLLIPGLYLAAFVWDVRLAAEPSATRLILIGVILIVLMNVRPQGLVGARRVEIA
jgi:ABC-type branched-subunit amino acid transport system permease subunit